MGHYITTYCEVHGEVDMDDGSAFCEECYETAPKGTTARIAALESENAELRADRDRLDWLEAEMNREAEAIMAGRTPPRSLFRRNIPITRVSIDAEIRAARKGE